MLTTESALRKDRTTGKTTLEHRHFATIALFIREWPYPKRDRLANYFANRLAETNPRFDRERFMRACDV